MKRLYIAVVCALLLLSCSDKGNRVVGTLSDVAFIAHAGGSIGGLAMTNSMEALYAARDKGYKYIELDLQFTSDSVLVAMHITPRIRTFAKREKEPRCTSSSSSL